MTRRSSPKFVAAGVALVAAVALSGCVTTSGAGGANTSGTDADGPAVIQSRFTDEAKGGVPDLIAAFEAAGGGDIELNSVASETYRQQLPTFLTSQTPPDGYTWFAGEATRSFANEGLLLDVSDVWDESLSDFPSALKKLSQDASGNEVFVPTNYYWWGVYYRVSEFERLGVEVPTTWEEFLDVSAKIKDQGVTPITIGLSDNAWLASAWFDYLDIRINGGAYHLDLLAGKHSFEDQEVKDVFAAWTELLPYFDPSALGVSFTQSVSDLSQGKAAMMLSGSYVQGSVPEDVLPDIGFFQFPTIDPSIPRAEEAPTDGFMAAATSSRPKVIKEFMAFAASPEGEKIILKANGDSVLAANPNTDIELGPLAQQGKEMLESADQLTQFFNRDAGDEVQPSADAALTQFFSDPDKIDEILATWQAEATKARESK